MSLLDRFWDIRAKSLFENNNLFEISVKPKTLNGRFAPRGGSASDRRKASRAAGRPRRADVAAAQQRASGRRYQQQAQAGVQQSAERERGAEDQRQGDRQRQQDDMRRQDQSRQAPRDRKKSPLSQWERLSPQEQERATEHYANQILKWVANRPRLRIKILGFLKNAIMSK